MTKKTREPQYQETLDIAACEGLARFGLMSNQVWRDDPKRLVFLLSRYKFVAKMLAGKRRVLELGCADAFGSRIVQQEVGSLVCTDFDPVFIADARERCCGNWALDCREHDILTGPVACELPDAQGKKDGRFDAAYTMDVIEHSEARHERTFVGNLARSLTPAGVLIVQESGGVATDFSGRPWTPATRDIVAANPALHAVLLAAIHEVEGQ